MDIGKIVKEGERVLPGIPTFPKDKPLPQAPAPAPQEKEKAPEREKVPA